MVFRHLCGAWGLSLILSSCAGSPDEPPPPAPAKQAEEPEPDKESPAPVPSVPAVAPLDVEGAGYKLPPQEVVAVADAPPTPAAWLSPSGELMVLGYYSAMPSIAAVAQPFEGLAGVRVDAQRHAERRTRLYDRFVSLNLASGETFEFELAPDSQMTSIRWSPDGKRVAFGRWTPQGIELWVADAASAKARRLTERRINDVVSPGFRWMPGSQSLLVWFVPADAGQAPERSTVPVGPVVDDTDGKKAVNRTYQDLLAGPEDEARFDYFAKSEMAVVSATGEEVQSLGEPQPFIGGEASPDGKYLLVDRLRKPYSYAVPYYRFSRVTEVWDRAGKVVRVAADQDVADEVPIGGVRVGPRMISWHDQHEATLLWTEALDEGDPKKEVEHRDRVMTHAAPFADVPKELLRTEHRLRSILWTSNVGQALVREYDRDRRWTTTWVHETTTEADPHKLIDRSVNDAYGDPGDPVYELRPDGTVVIPVHEGSIFLEGSGASPDGQRPFLDRMNLADGTTQRVFESEVGTHSEFVDFLSEDYSKFMIQRQSPRDVLNYHVVDKEQSRQVTKFQDPHPQLTGIEKQVLRYTRRDGVELSGTLYLPPNRAEGEKLPLVIWAYPREFNDPATAGQVRAAPNRFTRLRGTSALMFLMRGYAVLMGAAMPVVGDPETMNDTFIDQIVWSAEAAIDAVVELGVADRERVGIGGHSYGAFMTANLLAHSDLFKAGIARSGAYNRTLTPFGFQSERRTLWEAPQTYVQVSPLFAADKINEPLLLIHGENDANSGTYPLQSKRLFHAMKGNQGTARLVLLPHESHGYSARESVLHVLAEQMEWFDEHLAK